MILIKLLLAHIIGDFFSQPYSWIKEKEKKKFKSPKLYLHTIIHMAIAMVILWDISLWYLVVIIGLTHLIIDGLKLSLQNNRNHRWLFFIDQFLHLLIIFSLYYIFIQKGIDLEFLNNPDVYIVITSLLFLTQPTSIILKTIFSKWDLSKLTENNESLVDAGKYIGILERLLVFTFIITDHWEAVGFLITAKSVFRFGDLKESKHRKLTEYILIGTLISFSIAIITALVYLAFI